MTNIGEYTNYRMLINIISLCPIKNSCTDLFYRSVYTGQIMGMQGRSKRMSYPSRNEGVTHSKKYEGIIGAL